MLFLFCLPLLLLSQPSVSILYPKNERVYKSFPVKDRIEISTSDSIIRTEFWIGDSLFAAYDSAVLEDSFCIQKAGFYELRARVYTDSLTWAESNINIAIEDTAQMSVSFYHEEKESYYPGDTILLTLFAFYEDGTDLLLGMIRDEDTLAHSSENPLIYPLVLNDTGLWELRGFALAEDGETREDTLQILVQAPKSFTGIRINLGSPESDLFDGKHFSADTLSEEWFENFVAEIRATQWDKLYQSAAIGKKLRCSFDLPPGEYSLHVHLAEIEYGVLGGFSAISERSFSLFVEDKLRLSRFPMSEKLVPGIAAVRSFDLVLEDSVMEILFKADEGDLLIAGLEILPKGMQHLPLTEIPLQEMPVFVLAGPNPAKEEIAITVDTPLLGLLSLQILGLDAKPLQSYHFMKTRTYESFALSLEDVPPGAHLIKLSLDGQFIETIKLIKK